jgi:hypothetical protein
MHSRFRFWASSTTIRRGETASSVLRSRVILNRSVWLCEPQTAASRSAAMRRIVGREGKDNHSGDHSPAKASTARSTAKVFPSPAGPWITPKARWRAVSLTARVVNASVSVSTVDASGRSRKWRTVIVVDGWAGRADRRAPPGGAGRGRRGPLPGRPRGR